MGYLLFRGPPRGNCCFPDTRSWQEVDPPERPAPLAALAREFLSQYPADARAA